MVLSLFAWPWRAGCINREGNWLRPSSPRDRSAPRRRVARNRGDRAIDGQVPFVNSKLLQGFLEVGGQGGIEIPPLSGARMPKRQPPGVKHLAGRTPSRIPRESDVRPSAIDTVAH